MTCWGTSEPGREDSDSAPGETQSVTEFEQNPWGGFPHTKTKPLVITQAKHAPLIVHRLGIDTYVL